jgi:hypothetical protein
MLGDSAEGLKALALVFYRTALGHLVHGHFPDPNQLYYLYDRVRSYAAHGEAMPDVTEDEISSLNWNIRETLNLLVSFCSKHRLTSRTQVRRALIADGVDQLTLDYLREFGPKEWWGEWSPGPKPAKDLREQELAAKVMVLEAELSELRAQPSSLAAHHSVTPETDLLDVLPLGTEDEPVRSGPPAVPVQQPNGVTHCSAAASLSVHADGMTVEGQPRRLEQGELGHQP